MKSGTQVALAVGAGYLLGRRHKMRLALALGGAAMTGKAGGLTGQLLRQGTKLAGSSGPLAKVSPELGEVTDMVRGQLLDAGRAAALTAVRGRVDWVSDKLRDQVEVLRQRGDQGRPNGKAGHGVTGETAEERDDDTAQEPEDAGEQPQDWAEEEPEDAGEQAQDWAEEEPEDAGEQPHDMEYADEPQEGEDVAQAPSGDGSGRDSSYERSTTRTRSEPSPVRRTGR